MMKSDRIMKMNCKTRKRKSIIKMMNRNLISK